MSFNFESKNKGSKKTVRDGINTESMTFKPLKEFVGKTLRLDGFFFTKGKYGEQVVVIAEDTKINLPKRFTEDFKEFRDNDEALSDILAGKLQLVNIREIDANEGKTVTFDYKNA